MVAYTKAQAAVMSFRGMAHACVRQINADTRPAQCFDMSRE